MIDWKTDWSYIYGNRLPIISALSLVVSAAVKTLPMPGEPFSLYTWVYDAAHQFFNITNTRLSTQAILTPPLTKAEIASDPKLKGVSTP